MDDPYEELDGGIKLTHASGNQTFSGDIEADGAVHWLMLYRADKSAHFVGLQRITGSVGGRRGAFVLAAEGDHEVEEAIRTEARCDYAIRVGILGLESPPERDRVGTLYGTCQGGT
jgi:hypothetical protein